jgi:hypothetical protein
MARTHVRASTDNHATTRNTVVMDLMSVARESAAASSDVVYIGSNDVFKVRFQIGENAITVQVASSVATISDCRLVYVVMEVFLHRWNGPKVLISRQVALAIYINEKRRKENQRSRGRS